MNEAAANGESGSSGSRRAQHFFAPLIPDLATLSSQFETDLDIQDNELIELLATEVDVACEGLATAIPNRDPDTIRAHAHSLQGMGGAAGVPEISVVGQEFSTAARNQDFDRCAQLLQALQQWRRAE